MYIRDVHDVEFINNRGFLIPCAQPGIVYTRILCCLTVSFTVRAQNFELLYHDCPVKNVP